MVYQSIPENETLNFFFYVVHAVACLNLTKPLVVCASSVSYTHLTLPTRRTV